MSNENCGSAAWKSRLEDPAILGTTTSDTNALWEKLHGRLHEKPRRERVVWYWAAAACLLAAMILPFVKNNFSTKEAVTITVAKQQPATTVTPQISTAPAIVTNESSNVAVEKKQAVKSVKENTETKPLLDNTIPETAISNMPSAVQNDIQPLQNTIVSTGDKPVVVAAAGPVLKQKLKVVHINELGYPEETTHRDEHIADYRSIRFNPVNPETYTTSSTAQNVSDLNFFKIKTTPSN